MLDILGKFILITGAVADIFVAHYFIFVLGDFATGGYIGFLALLLIALYISVLKKEKKNVSK